MNFARRAALTSLYSIISITLFSFGLLLSLKLVLTNPQTIETSLSRSGIYDSLVHDILSQQNNETNNVPLERPEIQAAIEQAFPASELQKDANQIIDGTFAWLDGKTATPQFYVDLTANKEKMADNIATYAQHRVEGLPICTSVPIDTNIFTIPCRPPNLDINAATVQAKKDVLNATGPLEQSVLTPETLKNSKGQTLTQQFDGVPSSYQNAKMAMYAFLVTACIAAGVIMVIHQSKKAGLRRIGVTLVSVAAMSGIAAWLGAMTLQNGITRATQSAQNNEVLQAKFGAIVEYLANGVRSHWLLYAAVVGSIGLVVIIVSRFLPNPAAPKPIAEGELPVVPDTPPKKPTDDA